MVCNNLHRATFNCGVTNPDPSGILIYDEYFNMNKFPSMWFYTDYVHPMQKSRINSEPSDNWGRVGSAILSNSGSV